MHTDWSGKGEMGGEVLGRSTKRDDNILSL